VSWYAASLHPANYHVIIMIETAFRRLTLIAALTVPIAAPAQSTTLRQEIDALHVAMVDAFKKSPATVAAFYTDDARILGGGSRSIGREQVDPYWKQLPAGGEWKLEVLEVGGDSQTPWVRGISTLQSSSGRQMVTEYIGRLRRGPDGKLKFYVDMFTAAAPMTRAP
jgi:ketosteroid isomerase-like protein